MSHNFYEICFIDEIIAETYPTNNSKQVRVLGKLKSYNPATCIGRLSDPECKILQTLPVNLKNIEDISFIKDSLYQILGEIKDLNGEKILDACIVRNTEGIDVQMFKEAISLRRKFLLNH